MPESTEVLIVGIMRADVSIPMHAGKCTCMHILACRHVSFDKGPPPCDPASTEHVTYLGLQLPWEALGLHARLVLEANGGSCGELWPGAVLHQAQAALTQESCCITEQHHCAFCRNRYSRTSPAERRICSPGMGACSC